jgi:hypothetical protein
MAEFKSAAGGRHPELPPHKGRCRCGVVAEEPMSDQAIVATRRFRALMPLSGSRQSAHA